MASECFRFKTSFLWLPTSLYFATLHISRKKHCFFNSRWHAYWGADIWISWYLLQFAIRWVIIYLNLSTTGIFKFSSCYTKKNKKKQLRLILEVYVISLSKIILFQHQFNTTIINEILHRIFVTSLGNPGYSSQAPHLCSDYSCLKHQQPHVAHAASDSTDLDGKGHQREDQHSALTPSRYGTHIWHIDTSWTN